MAHRMLKADWKYRAEQLEELLIAVANALHDGERSSEAYQRIHRGIQRIDSADRLRTSGDRPMTYRVEPNVGPHSQAAKHFKNVAFDTELDAKEGAVLKALGGRRGSLTPENIERLWRSLEGAGWRISQV